MEMGKGSGSQTTEIGDSFEFLSGEETSYGSAFLPRNTCPHL